MTGLILFAHGARDERWREPFDQLLEQVRRGHDGPVELAFLELMQPDLATAASMLATTGVSRIVVVPLFLGTGGHLRRDLPRLLEQARQVAGVEIAAVPAAGEQGDVLDAIAGYCLRSGR